MRGFNALEEPPMADKDMMNPSEIFEAFGIAQNTLCDWRRRGYLSGMGACVNRRWKYTRHEVSAMVEARALVCAQPTFAEHIKRLID